ncbi:MAG: ATP-binding protein [Pseudomonadales bacterium]
MNDLSLRTQLILTFFTLSIVPFIFIAWLLLSFFTESMEEQALNHLVSVRNIKKAQITEYLNTLKNQTQYFVGDISRLDMQEHNTPILKHLVDFSAAISKLADDPQEAYRRLRKLYIPGSEDQPASGTGPGRVFYDYTHEDIHHHIKRFVDKFGYEDLFLVKADGYIVYSVKKARNLGDNLISAEHASSGLAQAFKKTSTYALTESTASTLASNQDKMPFFFTEFNVDNATEKMLAFVSIPLFKLGTFMGAVIYQIPVSMIDSIMAERAGLGDTGETYLVGQDYRLRSSVFRTLKGAQININTNPIKTAAVSAALTGKTDHQLTRSYLGDEVLSAYTPIDAFGFRWALVAEITTNEAYAGVYRLSMLTVVIALITLLLIVGVGLTIANSIARPVVALTRASEKIAAGDLQQTIDLSSKRKGPRRDELGRLALSFVAMRDAIADKITEIEQQNKALIRLDQLKDDLLANTTHELKTPLNGIIGLAESLIGGVPAHYTKTLHNIIASGTRLSHLVDDILDAARLKHKEIQLRLQPLNLRQIVDFNNAISVVGLGGKALHIINSVPEHYCVLADQNRLLQILQNLVGNAIKFSTAGEITITAVQKRALIEISVSDDGVGIPREDLQRIFHSFEQSDTTATRNHGGTGLGLAITQQLVTLHGGTIWAESAPGQGAIFTFTLPHSEEKAEAKPHYAFDAVATTVGPVDIEFVPTTPAHAHNGGFTILVVDDEPINLQVVTNHFLAVNGYRLITAYSGPEALTTIDAQKPDLILLDVMMPEMDGYQVCQRIREQHTAFDLPIIFLTARNQTTDLIKAFTAGGNDYLAKPFCKEELMARVSVQMDIRISRVRMAKLRTLANTISHCDTHEAVMHEAYALCESDPIIIDAAAFFDGDVLIGNRGGQLHYPDGLVRQKERLVAGQDTVTMYHSVSDFYTLGVKFPTLSSEEWVRNIALQISKSITQIRKISSNPDNALILSDIIPCLEQILFIQVEKNYCLVTKETDNGIKELILRIPFKQILFHVEKDQLLQVHRSYAVNPNKILSIHGKKQEMQLESNQTVPIAKKYVHELKRQFPQLHGVLT